jgi:hypothetical protein
MPILTAVFLETSVLDAQHYNFKATALSTFAAASAKPAVKLLPIRQSGKSSGMYRHVESGSRAQTRGAE